MPTNLELGKLRHGTELLKRGFAKMQKGGVVMDVTNADQAKIAERAGAVAVMALERVPADIRAEGGVARMADPTKVAEIIDAVSIPVMAKARIGHFVEAQVLQELGADMIDESEVLTPADPYYHIDKRSFTVPFVCGARTLPEATRRIFEGAAMIRTKGEAGTGNVVEAVRHRRQILRAIAELKSMDSTALKTLAGAYAESYARLYVEVQSLNGKKAKVTATTPVFAQLTAGRISKGVYDVLVDIKRMGRLPVVDFAAGGIATPADAALMMQLGNDGVFVGSGIFKSSDPENRARAIVEATTNYDDPTVLAKVSRGLGAAMPGQTIEGLATRLQDRGW
jgi:pyridoxal 5'-phosphate synthase pdxS subunit